VKLSDDGGLATILRQGDYCVYHADLNGIRVEFSPDGERTAPVDGAFAALRGTVITWSASEASELLRSHGADAEGFLLREVRRQRAEGIMGRVGAGVEPVEDLPSKLARLVAGFAREYAPGGVWKGFMPDFHREFIFKIHPVPLNKGLRAALSELDKRLPGIFISQEGKGYKWTHFTVDWEAVGQGD
jgi:hypothetical protein